jgi:hypothetical protein
MPTRRIVFLLALSSAALAVGLVAGRTRPVVATAPLADDGPTEPVAGVLAAFDADDEALSDAVRDLVAALSGDEPLLDRRPQYDWIDAYRLGELRAPALAALRGTPGDPSRVLGGLPRDTEALELQLAAAQGVFSAVTVGCSFAALRAELEPEEGERVEESEFADHPVQRRVFRRARELTVALGGARSDVLLRLTAQLEPATADAFHIRQHWELEVLVERDAATTARLVATWAEVTSDEYAAKNRVWSGWVLHGAFEDATAWTRACGGGEAAEDAVGSGAADGESGGPAATRTPVVTERGLGGAAQADGGLSATPEGVGLAPLCAGARLVRVEAHARKLRETELELAAVGRNFAALDAEIDAVTADLSVDPAADEAPPSAVARRIREREVDEALEEWRAEGIRRWGEVLGTPWGKLERRQMGMLGRLVDRFGDAPDRFAPAIQARLKERWRSGALAEFLDSDEVRIPVCPDDVAYVADQMGWRGPEARRANTQMLDTIVASVLLESGSVRAAEPTQWLVLRDSLSLAEKIEALFNSPDDPIPADL